jgi:hypothetical protein
MKLRVFLPRLIMLAIAWGPLIIIPFVMRPFHVDLMGFGMAWGLSSRLLSPSPVD